MLPSVIAYFRIVLWFHEKVLNRQFPQITTSALYLFSLVSPQIMADNKYLLILILMAVACGCCVLLCAVVTYLCVTVKRIRRKLDDLSRRGSFTLEMNKGDNARKRMSSGLRYTGEPIGVKRRQQSSIYSEPGESVEILERADGRESVVVENRQALGSAASTQNIVEKPREPEHVPLQFVNQGFSLEDSKRDSSSYSCESQPIYVNEEVFREDEQGIYVNEPIYQNNADLDRCNTMDISQIP